MEEEALPDHLRCNRSDGRQWRCKRRVKENMKLCELHYLQGRHRQFKEKVPESLKIQRMRKKALNRDKNLSSIKIRAQKVENLAKLMKRKRSNETSRKMKNLKRGDMQLELIRMVLKREVEKRKSKKKTKKKEEVVVEENSEGELMRELPNGLMAISSSSSPSPKPSNNVGSDSPCNVKVGVGLGQFMQRRIRSKNVEPIPIGTLQVLPHARNAAELRRAKRKKCHWCQRSVLRILTKCSSCQKQFFCSDCISERYLEKPEEVEMACPVCRRTCTCKDCIANHSKDTESKDFLGEKNKAEVILCIHYLICMLLPLLKEINQDQIVELETEAIINGKIPSNLHVKQAEFSGKERCCCNKCKTSILDLHRSCPNCSYNLCLNCCRDYQGSFHGSINMSISKPPNKKKTRSSGSKQQLQKKPIRTPKRNSNSKYPNSSASPPVWKPCNGIGVFSCPPKDFGGCGGSHLDLRCLFPLSWAKELEVSAEEIVCSYDFPETSDVSSGCSLCLGTGQKAEEIEQLQVAAVREDSNDNFLYHPTLMDIHRENFEHFQKHWSKGHPVIVRNVLQTAIHLSWDPVLMFCTYLERSIARYENNRDLCDPTNFLDWCEVEIGIRQYFMGSLKGQTHTNMWNETLKLKGWISSHLFQQQFPAHYAEMIHALPFQEYMNPASGLLNLAARLPQDIPMPDLGPCVYISYGCSEELVQADSVIKLCYDSYDMVNILTHTSDVPVPEEQISRIRKLLKKHKAQNERESSRITSDKKKVSKVRGKSALHGGEKEEAGLQNMIGEEMHLRKRVARLSCSSAATLEACPRNLKENNMLLDGESDSDSEALLHCDTTNGSESSEDKKNSGVYTQSSNHDGKEHLVESCGAQWDVFRRQDVPKLIEYLKRHSNEFTHTRDFQNLVIHPILDQSFFLDTAHKMKLKEEYKIEPWTFEQHVGEAVIIPAGCPYQIRSPKSCVHVVLDFISPESISECIQLTDEVRLLPEDHKAKVDKLEVKKIAIHSISSAIKEIRELTYPM